MKQVLLFLISVLFVSSCVSVNSPTVSNDNYPEKINPYTKFKPVQYGKTIVNAAVKKESFAGSQNLTQVAKGEILTVLGAQDSFFKIVTSKGNTGWVRSNRVEFISLASHTIGYAVFKSPGYTRGAPSKQSPELYPYFDRYHTPVVEVDNQWVRVVAGNNQLGWVPINKIDFDRSSPSIARLEKELEPEKKKKSHEKVPKISQYAVFKTSGYSTAKPSENSAEIFRYTRGYRFPVVEIRGRWIKIVSKKNKAGWVVFNKIDIDKSSRSLIERQKKHNTERNRIDRPADIIGIAVSKNAGQTRTRPSGASARMGQVGYREPLPVIRIKDGWFKVVTSIGENAWIHSRHIDFYSSSLEIRQQEQAVNESVRISKIKTLEEKVRTVPSSHVQERLYIYEELLKLDPGNKKYKSKVRFYTQKHKELKQQNAKKTIDPNSYNERMRAESDIEIISWNWNKESGGYVKAKGSIKNVSGRKLDRVQAVVTWFTKDGRYIGHKTSLIEFKKLLNNQKSSFEVIDKADQKIKHAELNFSIRGKKLKSFLRK